MKCASVDFAVDYRFERRTAVTGWNEVKFWWNWVWHIFELDAVNLCVTLNISLALLYKIVHGHIAVPTDDIVVTADTRTRSNHQYKYRYNVRINCRVQELLLPKDNQGMEQLLSGLDWKQFTGRFQKLACSTQPAPMLIAWICWNPSVWYSFGGWLITKTRQDKTRCTFLSCDIYEYCMEYRTVTSTLVLCYWKLHSFQA